MIQLSGPELRELTVALNGAFATQSRLEELIDYMDLTPRRSLSSMTTQNDTPPDMVRKVIKTAEREGWLLQLVLEAHKVNQENDALKKIVARFQQSNLAAAAAPSHFYQTCFMGPRPFVDREDLRAALSRLDAGNRKIVVVKGAPHSGKSYTVQFIAYLRLQLQTFELAWVDLRDLARPNPETVIVVTPKMVATSIVEQLKLPAAVIPEKAEETWDSWNTSFCDRLNPVVAELAKPAWIVIDSFEQVRVPQETLALIKHIAKRLSVTLGNLRLVLLAYNDDLPGDLRLDIVTEEIPKLTPAHLSLFLTRIFDQLKAERQMEFTTTDVARATACVLRAVPPKDATPLLTMALKITELCDRILTGQDVFVGDDA
jgi:hypothetical protein